MFSADPNYPRHTFESRQNGATIRIDAIFTSPDFSFFPLYCHTRKSFLYLSDHLIIAAYFQPVDLKKEKHEHHLRTRRKVFNINKMDNDTWQNFTDYSNKYVKEHNLHKYESLKANRHNLNVLWMKIKDALIITANKTIPYSFRSAEDDLPKPKCLTSCYSALTKLNNILLKFRTKYITRSLWPDHPTWISHKDTVNQIIREHHLEAIILPSHISADNV